MRMMRIQKNLGLFDILGNFSDFDFFKFSMIFKYLKDDKNFKHNMYLEGDVKTFNLTAI